MKESRNKQASPKQTGPAESVNQLFYFTKRLHANAEQLAERLQFDENDPGQACLVSLYLSLLELSGAFLLLIEQRRHVLLPSTMRSILEAYVDYENLRKDGSYLTDMEYYHLGQHIKILEAGKAGTNLFVSDIAKLEDLEQRVKDQKERRIQLRKGKAKSYRMNERFSKAGLADWYDGLYGFLSANTHACISSIFHRQFVQDGKSVCIVHDRMLSPDLMIPHLDLTAGVLLDASQKIQDRYGGEKKETFSRFGDALAAIRKGYTQDQIYREQ